MEGFGSQRYFPGITYTRLVLGEPQWRLLLDPSHVFPDKLPFILREESLRDTLGFGFKPRKEVINQ